jgi:hypothetical protein
MNSSEIAPNNAVREPETIDGSTLRLLPTPRRRKPQLTSLEGVRCEMARVYREVEEGKRDSQEGSRLIYMLSQITKVLELTEIERRLTVLEGKNG